MPWTPLRGVATTVALPGSRATYVLFAAANDDTPLPIGNHQTGFWHELLNMLLRFFRQLFGSRSASQIQRPVVGAVSTRDSESFEGHVAQLTSRMPFSLRETFQDAIRSPGAFPLTGPELLDALDRIHRGLGVAIGRGTTGEDQRYQRLGQIVDWLYEELGRPQDTEYAVVKRAAIEWKKGEASQGKG